MRIAIAGATGFVGTALSQALADAGHEVIGLCRTPRQSNHRKCDLYVAGDVEAGLRGVDVAIYLVHSMMPSARLTQARFEDLDLILADNFARAAAKNGVKQIVYLGGLVPAALKLSKHLQSRLEVEKALAGHGTPVTSIRAGLIVGAGGSSLRIVVNLVKRLPAMITPRWTLNETHPVALQDVVRAFERCVGDPAFYNGSFDIYGPDVMTYREMIVRTAAVLGVERRLVGFPFLTTGLSKLWVSLVTGTPLALVGPLVDSLRHPMVGSPNPLQAAIAEGLTSYEQALRAALATESERKSMPTSLAAQLQRRRRGMRSENTVRSVQRLPLPERDASWIASEYIRWLPSLPIPGLHCDVHGDHVYFRSQLIKKPLLILRVVEGTDDIASFNVVGGVLAKKRGGVAGRLEFRRVMGHLLAAVHEFRPSLPWMVYNGTQAIGHLAVMRAFGRHLRTQS